MKAKGEGNNKNNFRLAGVTLKSGYLPEMGPLEAEIRSSLDTFRESSSMGLQVKP